MCLATQPIKLQPSMPIPILPWMCADPALHHELLDGCRTTAGAATPPEPKRKTDALQLTLLQLIYCTFAGMFSTAAAGQQNSESWRPAVTPTAELTPADGTGPPHTLPPQILQNPSYLKKCLYAAIGMMPTQQPCKWLAGVSAYAIHAFS